MIYSLKEEKITVLNFTVTMQEGLLKAKHLTGFRIHKMLSQNREK